jgi:hypothetical protein
MTKRLIERARRIQKQPWNRRGADKTWVPHAMWQQQLLLRQAREAWAMPDDEDER